MNVFLVIILVAVVVEFLLGVVSNLLNLSALRPEAPEGLEDVYEPDKYAKSQEYTKVNIGFDLITGTFKLALLLTFWLFGGFNWLDQLVREWELHVILNGVLYIWLLGLAYMVITLPFSIYKTFVIEEQFGFNKTTWGTFVLDRVKALGLGIALGAPLLGAILAFFEYAGDLAWLYAWVAVTIVSLAIQFIAPTWIMPHIQQVHSPGAGRVAGLDPRIRSLGEIHCQQHPRYGRARNVPASPTRSSPASGRTSGSPSSTRSWTTRRCRNSCRCSPTKSGTTRRSTSSSL